MSNMDSMMDRQVSQDVVEVAIAFRFRSPLGPANHGNPLQNIEKNETKFNMRTRVCPFGLHHNSLV